MIKNQIGFSLLTAMALVGACSYTAPTESTNSGSQGGMGGSSSSSSASISSSGQPGVGGNGGGASSSSSGEGGSSSSSSGGTKADVECGTFSCLGTALCCIKPGLPPYYGCAEPGTCENAEVRCDGPEDCTTGFECCGMVDVNGNFLKLQCAKECMAAESIICHTDKMPTDCPAPLGCSPLPTLGNTYGACE